MSYIRSTSNPEGLYIYQSTEGGVWIYHSLKPPLASSGNRDLIIVPTTLFHAACRAWVRHAGMGDSIRRGNLTITEALFPPACRQFRQFKQCRHSHEIKVRVQYQRQFVLLWAVTWDYVVHRFRIEYLVSLVRRTTRRR